MEHTNSKTMEKTEHEMYHKNEAETSDKLESSQKNDMIVEACGTKNAPVVEKNSTESCGKIRPKISVVIPMLNEEESIPVLFSRLFPVMTSLPESYEIVCVDDGSRDHTLQLLKEQQKQNPRLAIVSFMRNFGQHTAIMAGFEVCQGDWIITMDADLQNPPEEIPKIVEKFREGYDLIGTIRQNRQDPVFRKVASFIVNVFIKKISGISLQDYGCMLRGYSQNIAKTIASRPEYRTFLPALGTLYAGKPIEISISHAPRERGNSKYSVFKLLSLFCDVMTGFSVWPLRFLFFCGFALAFIGIIFGFLLFSLRVFYGPRWAGDGVFTIFAVLFFFIGAQFFAFGLLGEYIGRIYQEVRKRPHYIVKEYSPSGK